MIGYFSLLHSFPAVTVASASADNSCALATITTGTRFSCIGSFSGTYKYVERLLSSLFYQTGFILLAILLHKLCAFLQM